jgi:hypothetical protein
MPGGDQTVRVAVGVGEAGAVTASEVRDAAATFSRALPHLRRLALHVQGFAYAPVAAAAGAVVEGAVPGRYHFHIRAEGDTVELAELSLVVEAGAVADADAGAQRGRTVAEVISLGRDFGHQSNLMVMRPGGYTTQTFARFGVPLILGSLVGVCTMVYLLLRAQRECRALGWAPRMVLRQPRRPLQQRGAHDLAVYGRR